MISVKKLLASLLTVAIAVVMSMGTVGCQKKEEKKTETKIEEKKDGKTDTKTETKTETKTPPSDTKKP